MAIRCKDGLTPNFNSLSFISLVVFILNLYSLQLYLRGKSKYNLKNNKYFTAIFKICSVALSGYREKPAVAFERIFAVKYCLFFIYKREYSCNSNLECTFAAKTTKMRRLLLFILTVICVISASAEPRRKVAVVLSGGGAKGAAHVGVLKVLEEAGIPIDYIVGTSMGSIVGGLYAIGYNAAALDTMIMNQDWRLLLSDDVPRDSKSFPEKENSEKYIITLPFGIEKKDRIISGVIRGQNLFNLFSDLTIGYHDSVDFNALRIPFACVAVDAVTGKEYVFRSGSLPLAMRASMAMPAVFSPVKLDSLLLIDGGLNNNYPVDVALSMGAEIIIGVDVQPGKLKSSDELNMATDVIAQLVALHGFEKYKENLERTDLLIRPDMTSYNSASFSIPALDTLINRGETAARSQWNELMRLKEKIGIDQTYGPDTLSSHGYVKPSDTICIRNISFIGINPEDKEWLLRVIKLRENSKITQREMQKAMSNLFGTNAFSEASYKLTGEGPQHDLVLTVKQRSISSLNLGLRFDTEEIVSVLLNATLDYRSKFNSRIAVTGRIGQSSYGRVDYAIEKNPLRNFNLAYMFDYSDLNIYSLGNKSLNPSWQHHLFEFGYSDVNWLNFKFKVGARYEYFKYSSLLSKNEGADVEMNKNRFTSCFGQVHLETLDRRYFPTKGVSLKADYSLYVDDFIGNEIQSSFSTLALDFKAVLPVTSHFSVLPSVYGRVVFGKPAFPFANMVGGEVFGRYLPQQLPFAGINRLEVFEDAVAVARIHLRQRIGQRHYISLIGNYGLQHDDFLSILKGQSIWGGSLGYAYHSIAGPLSVTLSMSDYHPQNHVKVLFYMSLGYFF